MAWRPCNCCNLYIIKISNTSSMLARGKFLLLRIILLKYPTFLPTFPTVKALEKLAGWKCPKS